MPVQRSLQGNLLLFSGPDYLSRLHRGANLLFFVMIARVAQLALTVLFILALILSGLGWGRTLGPATLSIPAVRWGWDSANILLSAASLVGWWWFSAPDPGVRVGDRGERPRRLVRIAVVLLSAVAVYRLASRAALVGATSPAQNLVVGVAEGIVMVVQHIVAMLYVRWLAPRIPDRTIQERARLYLWLLPLLHIVGFCVLFLGPLIATVLQVLLINRIRQRIGAIRRRQAKELAAIGISPAVA